MKIGYEWFVRVCVEDGASDGLGRGAERDAAGVRSEHRPIFEAIGRPAAARRPFPRVKPDSQCCENSAGS